MAEEAPKHDPLKDLYFFLTIVVIIVILWFAAGGPGKADMQGIFLAPPQPLGGGAAYGPGGPTTTPQFQSGAVPAPQQINY